MPENENNTPNVAPIKLTKDQKISLVLTATAIGLAGIAALIIQHQVSAVTSTVDQLLLTLQDQEIIGNVQIGK